MSLVVGDPALNAIRRPSEDQENSDHDEPTTLVDERHCTEQQYETGCEPRLGRLARP
jgi:hypothetical protein